MEKEKDLIKEKTFSSKSAKDFEKLIDEFKEGKEVVDFQMVANPNETNRIVCHVFYKEI